MKQNERLLVYAVTGFLALILVIAVLFGSEPADAASKQENLSKGLSDLLSPKAADSGLQKAQSDTDAESKALSEQLLGGGSTLGAGNAAAGPNLAGNPVRSEQPLIAKPQLASSVVARTYGASRRERFVRWVTVKAGDSFDRLTRRWCGTSKGYSDEALSLNEDKTTLIAGQQVMVPWVDDEVLAAIIETQTLESQATAPVGSVGNPAPASIGTAPPGMPRPSATQPVFSPARGASDLVGSPRASTSRADVGATSSATVSYTVKPGDSLWAIGAKRYGKGNADKMIRVILGLNRGLTENLKAGQVILLPAKAE